ncbi:uncharacterized protein LOC133890750 [Phragmites australis]|uniref:uncharacterized protein LOC133890750 n=1 Tax=Phragmites australis TaxID=29695 RepID=UPI002D7884A2|nr:uncharacterized protein LOC133890750 [Phragmites australis]
MWDSTMFLNFISHNIQVAQFYSDNHPHIVCEHGRHKFTSMMSFLGGKDMLKSVDVPGTNTQIKVTQEVLRRLLVGMFVRCQHLHSEGKTLEGCFSADNMFVPDQDVFMIPYIEVKLDSLRMEAFKPYTDEGGDKDLMKLGVIVEDVILSSETELPADLKQLFVLLRTEPIKNKNLIYCHVSLKGPRGKLSHFMWLYKRLTYLQKKVPSKYEKIMLKFKDDKDNWRKRANRNKFLAKLRPFNTCGRGGYSKHGKGLSRFYRNSVEHLLKMFDDNNPNSGTKPEEHEKKAHPASPVEEEELEDYHIAIILTQAFPEFLGDLQEAFHEQNELQRFNTEDTVPLQNAAPAVATSEC